MELGAMASCPSQSVMSDPRYSVSQRAQAVTSSPVQLACWPIAADVEEDCPEEWCYDWESDRTEDWHDDWSWPTPEEQSSEWHDDEGCYLVCGVAGSNPNPKQQKNVDKVKLMIDCGSQSTASGVNFAKAYETDDSERAKLWDIQDQKIEAHGKKIVDVMFHGQNQRSSNPSQHQSGRV